VERVYVTLKLIVCYHGFQRGRKYCRLMCSLSAASVMKVKVLSQ